MGGGQRAVVVALVGIIAVAVIVTLFLVGTPDSVAEKAQNNAEYFATVASAAITGIVALVGAYLGVRSANASREGSETARVEAETARKEAEQARSQAERGRRVDGVRLRKLSEKASPDVASAADEEAKAEIAAEGVAETR
jgi:Na+/melibiose symporter-like transporter